MLSPVSVHIQLQVPASEGGGLQGEGNEDFHKNTGFSAFFFFSRLISYSLCLFQVKGISLI